MANESQPLQIGISYDQGIPEQIIADLISDISAPDLCLKSEAREPSVYANVEWYIPTALIIFIGKAYFDSFLKEMGKEHYHALKKGITSLWKYFFGSKREINYKVIATEGKISEPSQYSIAVSIMTDLPGKYRIKFLFKDNLSEENFKDNIDQIFKLLSDLSSGNFPPEIDRQLQNENIRHTLVLSYEGEFRILNAKSKGRPKNET